MDQTAYRKMIQVGNLFCFPLSRSNGKLLGIVKEVHPFIASVTFRLPDHGNTYQVMFEEVIPIPMTEKRLEKLKFKGIWKDGKAEINGKVREVKYIHELQNFYREEIGEEFGII